ncbi:hypothetical protein DFJ77DRAFT_506545 [Powellomyces hirtus]|nr:hypothetical protein DFJ77DRAFT_506545 [Powellomyces hirtus]
MVEAPPPHDPAAPPPPPPPPSSSSSSSSSSSQLTITVEIISTTAGWFVTDRRQATPRMRGGATGGSLYAPSVRSTCEAHPQPYQPPPPVRDVVQSLPSRSKASATLTVGKAKVAPPTGGAATGGSLDTPLTTHARSLQMYILISQNEFHASSMVPTVRKVPALRPFETTKKAGSSDCTTPTTTRPFAPATRSAFLRGLNIACPTCIASPPNWPVELYKNSVGPMEANEICVAYTCVVKHDREQQKKYVLQKFIPPPLNDDDMCMDIPVLEQYLGIVEAGEKAHAEAIKRKRAIERSDIHDQNAIKRARVRNNPYIPTPTLQAPWHHLYSESGSSQVSKRAIQA